MSDLTMSRRGLQRALGALWLFDGLLQLKPQMFTQAFLSQVILPNAEGQPAWVAAPIQWAVGVVGPHIAVWNALFIVIQLLIGIALVLDVRPRLALAGSFVWAFIVWWAGEGLGELFTGSSLVATGAPGAIVLYVLAGIALWPGRRDGAELSAGGQRAARTGLALLWIGGAALQLQTAFLSAKGFASALPVGWAAHLIAASGVAAVAVAVALQLAIGVGVLVAAPRLRVAAWASILLSLLFWWVGQEFGEFWAPLGTDPQAGPLWVLLTLCAFPALLANLKGARSGRGR